ncbi:hypothetical protein OROHE_022266 [Orobanche hederae]
MSEKANINCSDAERTRGRSWLWASTEEFSSDEREWFFCARFEVRSGFNDGARLFMGCSTSGLFGTLYYGGCSAPGYHSYSNFWW